MSFIPIYITYYPSRYTSQHVILHSLLLSPVHDENLSRQLITSFTESVHIDTQPCPRSDHSGLRVQRTSADYEPVDAALTHSLRYFCVPELGYCCLTLHKPQFLLLTWSSSLCSLIGYDDPASLSYSMFLSLILRDRNI